ncbi:hypothetical protein ABPG72_005417 [Tetrahymena utriculariae]
MDTFFLQCPKHPQKKIKFLVNSISEDQQVLICSQCISDSLIKKGEFILISQIMQQGQNNLIQKWPPLEDSQIINKLVDLKQKQSNENQMGNIIQFFDKLKQEILQKIDAIQKSVLMKAKDQSDQNEQIIQKYQEISQIHRLRQILMNQSQQAYDYQEQQCKQLIKTLEDQKEKNQFIFQDLYINFSQDGKENDFESNNIIKQQILFLLDELSFLKEKQMEEQEELNKSNHSQLPKKKQNIQSEQKSTSETIYQLISNKSNYCQDQFLKDIKLILNRIEPLLSQIKAQNICQIGKKPMKFRNLNKQNLEKIENYIQHVSKINQKKKQYIIQIEQSQQIQQINKILNQKWNFLTESFKNNFREYLIETHPFMSSLNIDQITLSRENFESLQTLKDEETNELAQLIRKRREFSQQQNFNQSHSKKIVDELNNELSLYIPQNKINKLFSEFPIFDLVEFNKKISILQKIYLFENSNQNELTIKKHQNNQISVQSKEYEQTKMYRSCLSNFDFQKNLKYIIRINIEKINNRDFAVFFMVGLQYEYQYLKFFSNQSVIQSEFQYNRQQLFQQLQPFQQNFSNNNQIEIRIHLDQLLVEVLDYPYYINKIIMINQSLKQNLQNIKQCKLLLSVMDNIKLTITEAFIDKEQQ